MLTRILHSQGAAAGGEAVLTGTLYPSASWFEQGSCIDQGGLDLPVLNGLNVRL